MRRALVYGVAAVGLIATQAATQQRQDTRLVSRLEPRAQALIIPIVDSAARSGLPVEPLISKALEGQGKRAEPARIAAVLRSYANDLRAAQSALGPLSSEDEITAGAAALRAGVPIRELIRIRSARTGTRIASALTVLGGMLSRSVPADTASALVYALVRVGATDQQISDVGKDIEVDILAGRAPATVASVRARALEQIVLASLPPENGGTGSGSLTSPRGNTRPPANVGLPGQAAGTANGTVGAEGGGAGRAGGANRPPPSGRAKPVRKP
jgi:hypothetical protein